MFKELQKGWIPPEHISEEEYIKVKDNKSDYPDYYVGYVGFNSTFGAKYFGGYARDKQGTDKSNMAYRNLMKQLPNIKSINFTSGDYMDNCCSAIKNAVIYCDPPYKDTTKYKAGKFDYKKFYEWCKEKSKDNIVIISEYNMPDDFKCIWSKEQSVNFDSNRISESKRVEKLFVA